MPARPSALARRRARYPSLNPTSPLQQDVDTDTPSDDTIMEGLAEEIMGLTVSDEGPDVTSQPSRLWTARQQFQEARLPLERIANTSLTAAIADTFQLVTSPGSSSNPSVPALHMSQLGIPATSNRPAPATSIHHPPTTLHMQTPVPSPLYRPKKQGLGTSTMVEEIPNEEEPPPLAMRSASSPSPPVMQTPLPSSSPIQPLHIPANKTQLPCRLPRRSAAQKAIEDDLRTASQIALDLDRWEETAALKPTTEYYHRLRRQLDQAEKSAKLLNHRDARVQTARNDLLARCSKAGEILVVWRGELRLPDEPRTVDTSE